MDTMAWKEEGKKGRKGIWSVGDDWKQLPDDNI